MKSCHAGVLGLAACLVPAAHADWFGSGENRFRIEFVDIGAAGNRDDRNAVGAVPYEYRIGKHEVSESMIDAANALGGLGLTHNNRGPDLPATDVSWFDAARFVNWLNTSNGHTPAYKFVGSRPSLWAPEDPGYDANNLYRNRHAFYFLPSEDEWYKAAYYDPIADVYYDYSTGSNTPPDGIDSPDDTQYEVVYFDGGNSFPRPVHEAGVLSPFGTVGQGGNAMEWLETEDDNTNNEIDSSRMQRGGFWNSPSGQIRATFRPITFAGANFNYVGFRVASVPEPSGAAALLIGCMALVGHGRRSTTESSPEVEPSLRGTRCRPTSRPGRSP